MVLAGNHIVKVKDDFQQMEELKVRAEVANVAKSEVLFPGILLAQFISSFDYSPITKTSFSFNVSF